MYIDRTWQIKVIDLTHYVALMMLAGIDSDSEMEADSSDEMGEGSSDEGMSSSSESDSNSDGAHAFITTSHLKYVNEYQGFIQVEGRGGRGEHSRILRNFPHSPQNFDMHVDVHGLNTKLG